MRWRILAALLWCGTAYGQIAGPTLVENSPPEPIKFSVAAPMPEGAEFTGGWQILPLEGAGEASFEDLKAPNTIGVWAQGGTKYRLTFSGFWIHLGPEITVTDIHGNPQTFRPYLGHGLVNYTHEVVVKGTSPDPPDPPTPSGKYDVVMFYDKDSLRSMPKEKNAVLNSDKLRQDMAADGHEFLQVFEDDVFSEGIDIKFKPFVEPIKGEPMPVVVVRDKDTGEVKWKPLPASPEAMLALLKEWK